MRKTNIVMSWILTFALLLGLLPMVTPVTATATATGNGSNGKFLAPIEAPTAGSIAISNRAELEAIKNNLGGTYHLAGDIDLSDAEWVPIAPNWSDTAFSGILDGQGHSIKNLSIINSDYEYNGLFGVVRNATIKNISLEDVLIYISSAERTYVGSIAGYISGSNYSSCIIENCYSIGTITASAYTNINNIGGHIGGLIGGSGTSFSGNWFINNCYNRCAVQVNNSDWAVLGGIIGNANYSESSAIYNCHNWGSLSSASSDSVHIGGIAGYKAGGTELQLGVNKCSNRADITIASVRSTMVGGIIGSADYLAHGEYSIIIDSCFNSGDITAEGSEFNGVGGIAGLLGSSSTTISNCYNSGHIIATTPNTSVHAGGIVGYTTYTNFSYEIINCYNSGDISATSPEEWYGNNMYVAGISSGGLSTISPSIYPPITACVVLSTSITSSPSNSKTALISSGTNNKTNCIAYENIVGYENNDADLLISLTAAKDKNTYKDIGWDFDDVWDISDSVNNGYPYLRGMTPSGGNASPGESFTRLRKWIEEFSYAGSGDTDTKVWKEQIYYDDYYFNNDSYAYNHELATMSLALAMSAYNSKDAKTNNYSAESAGKNVQALLNNTGFKDIDITSYAGKPTQDSIGVALGHKKAEDGSTLIAVAVRGGGYEAEWAGNFNISGYGENHDGFDIAQGTALSKLGTYVKEKGINGPIKIWIVGFSRGAATANLLSATLHNSGLKAYTTAVTLQEKDIYTYTFATPQNTKSSYAHDARYNNIFNIINPIDFVPKVALTDWGYSRYGIDRYTPSSERNKETYESLSPKTLERFKAVIGNATFGGAAYVNLPQLKEQSATFDQILHELYADIGNEKSTSSQRILKAIREIMLTINDSDDKSKYELARALVSASKNTPELQNLINALIQAGDNPVDGTLDNVGELYYIVNIIRTAHNPGLYLAWMLTTNEQTISPADNPSSWAADQVNAAISAKLVPQFLQSKYTQATTRAEFCALGVSLYETVTGREITGRTTFTDTTDVNVQKMAALGIVNGIGDNKFGPGNKLTREQAATMLSRLADAIGKPLSSQAPVFSDSASISSWASDAVGQMQATGVMGGVGNNTFAPKSDYTREQSIITMMRMFNIVKWG